MPQKLSMHLHLLPIGHLYEKIQHLVGSLFLLVILAAYVLHIVSLAIVDHLCISLYPNSTNYKSLFSMPIIFDLSYIMGL